MLYLSGLRSLACLALVVSLQVPEELLRKSDVGMLTPASLRTLLVLKGPDSRAHPIEVWRSGDAKTLIRFMEPKERGKYLLRLGDQLWLLAPGAKKPVKVSSSYRIYGGGTLDEVMGLRLWQQYDVDSVSEEASGSDGLVTFQLRARSGKMLFPRVEYVVRKSTERPVRAVYKLRSERPATSVEFMEWNEQGPVYPKRLVVRDLLRQGAVTEVTVFEFDVRPVSDALFELDDSSARRALEREGSDQSHKRLKQNH